MHCNYFWENIRNVGNRSKISILFEEQIGFFFHPHPGGPQWLLRSDRGAAGCRVAVLPRWAGVCLRLCRLHRLLPFSQLGPLEHAYEDSLASSEAGSGNFCVLRVGDLGSLIQQSDLA